jgi:hypothetical protein
VNCRHCPRSVVQAAKSDLDTVSLQPITNLQNQVDTAHLADFLLGRNFTMPWMWNKRLTSFRGSLTSIVLDFLKTVCLCHGPLRRGVCASMNRLGPDAEDRAWDYPAIGPRK